MRILPTIALIALACIAAAQDSAVASSKVDITRKYKTGAVHKYRLVAKIVQGADMVLKGVIETKVAKELEKGKADLDVKCLEFSQSANGQEGGDPPENGTATFDVNGMPKGLHVDNNSAIYVALAIATYVPGKGVSVNEEYKIDWKGVEGGSIAGTGRLTEVKEVNGKKIGVLKSKLSVSPANDDTPAELEVTAEIDLSDGSLLKASVKGRIGEGDVTYTVESIK